MNSKNCGLFPQNCVIGLLLIGVLAAILGRQTATGDIIFDNSINDLGRRFDPRELEVGDEIEIAGAARCLTNFSFEYWGDSAIPGSFEGNVEARVRFYRNDGQAFNGFTAPGTLFYDSGWFGVGPTLRSQLIFLAGSDFPEGGLYLPVQDFTWTLQFQGLGTGDAAGVDLYNPVQTGFSYADYWQNDPNGWALKTNHNSVVNFAAKVQAYSSPPPPTPALKIFCASGQITVAWPWTATTSVLESSSSLGPEAVWSRVTQGISVTNGFFTVNPAPSEPARFYRLHQQ